MIRGFSLAASALVPILALAVAGMGSAAGRQSPEGELSDQARELWRQIETQDDSSDDALARWVDTLLVDVERFQSEPAFRHDVLAAIAAARPLEVAPEVVHGALGALSRRLHFSEMEGVEVAWGTVPRGSLGREVSLGRTLDERDAHWRRLTLPAATSPIDVSIYSLPSPLVDEEEARSFVRAVLEWAPERRILILADLPRSRSLAALASDDRVALAQTWGAAYSPWPRDPMTFLRNGDGDLLAVVRPNRQATRELDSRMALELVQELPGGWAGGGEDPHWGTSPVPFHNGNLLSGDARLWASLHTFEPRILELLGLDRVPVESFSTAAGLRRYLDAAERAANELGALYGRTIEWVHDLPANEVEPSTAARSMVGLGGGAGFDLDSIVTILPAVDGDEAAALVGSLREGERLLVTASDEELTAFASFYGFRPEAFGPAQALSVAQRSERAGGLEAFLDRVARHLEREGLRVGRLPLLLTPMELVEHAADYPDSHFLIGWNNVVLERVGDRWRAEGFSSALAAGDRVARARFDALGYQLGLLPALRESVLRNGGYRCASNHIRGTD